jgi:hypothetical protein
MANNFVRYATSTMAISDWPIPFSGRESPLRIAISVAVLLATLLSLTLVLLEILRSPLAALLAVSVGVLVRCLGQQLNVKQVLHSPKAAQLAAFDFDGQVVSCRFKDSLIAAYTNAWRWRVAASIAAGFACLAALYMPGLRFTLLPSSLFGLPATNPGISHWLYLAIEGCSSGLPLFASALFLRFKGPEGRWTNQVKVAIERRAAASVGQIFADHEIEGLEAGIEVLWRELGVDRSGGYRAAISRRVRSHTAEVVLQPATAIAMLQAVTELARLDLRNLSAAVESVHRIRCEVRVLQALASAFRNPLHEMKAEELGRELEMLSQLAANRQWVDLQSRAAWLRTELNDLRERIRRHSPSVPAVMLPPGSDPYRLLGVSVDTPTPLIRKLRSRLAQLYHPDVSDSISNSAKMAELNAAYDAIMRDRDREGH